MNALVLLRFSIELSKTIPRQKQVYPARLMGVIALLRWVIFGGRGSPDGRKDNADDGTGSPRRPWVAD